MIQSPSRKLLSNITSWPNFYISPGTTQWVIWDGVGKLKEVKKLYNIVAAQSGGAILTEGKDKGRCIMNAGSFDSVGI